MTASLTLHTALNENFIALLHLPFGKAELFVHQTRHAAIPAPPNRSLAGFLHDEILATVKTLENGLSKSSMPLYHRLSDLLINIRP